jgi:serine/threonine protein kinase
MAEQRSLSGQILGEKYLLRELLGEGGFGMVYAGQHLLLDRHQAIKLLLERYFRQPKFRERFLREAKLVAALDHLHIVHIDDFGLEEQVAKAYLVMPFIGRGTFQDILKEARKQQRSLDMEQVVSFLEQISSALDYAHQRGVVHLDLKPQNLLIHDDGRVLLADFGLAHLLKQGDLEGGTSLKYGTAHYMAPEHIQGHPEKQSDVYALGVILYQMLTGRRPFEEEGLTPAVVMMKHLTELPPPLQKWRPELQQELEGVLERALAKEVAQRYQSAGELLEAFKDALTHAQGRLRKADEEQVCKAGEVVPILGALVPSPRVPSTQGVNSSLSHPLSIQTPTEPHSIGLPVSVPPAQPQAPIQNAKMRKDSSGNIAIVGATIQKVGPRPRGGVGSAEGMPPARGMVGGHRPDRDRRWFLALGLLLLTSLGVCGTLARLGLGTSIKQTPGVRATGAITFYNAAFVDQQVNAGTMFNLAGGVRIVTDRAIDIPKASAPPNSHPGVASVSAHATAVGPAGNVAALTIDGACCSADGSIFAKNLTAFTGGQDPQNVTFVQQRDISGIVTAFISEVMRISTGVLAT